MRQQLRQDDTGMYYMEDIHDDVPDQDNEVEELVDHATGALLDEKVADPPVLKQKRVYRKKKLKVKAHKTSKAA